MGHQRPLDFPLAANGGKELPEIPDIDPTRGFLSNIPVLCVRVYVSILIRINTCIKHSLHHSNRTQTLRLPNTLNLETTTPQTQQNYTTPVVPVVPQMFRVLSTPNRLLQHLSTTCLIRRLAAVCRSGRARRAQFTRGFDRKHLMGIFRFYLAAMWGGFLKMVVPNNHGFSY